MTWLPLLTKIQTISADVTPSPVSLRKGVTQHWDNASNSSWTYPLSKPLVECFCLWVIMVMMSLHSNRRVTKTSLVILGTGNQSIPKLASCLPRSSKLPAGTIQVSSITNVPESGSPLLLATRIQFTSPACHQSLCPKDLSFHLSKTRMFTPER